MELWIDGADALADTINHYLLNRTTNTATRSYAMCNNAKKCSKSAYEGCVDKLCETSMRFSRTHRNIFCRILRSFRIKTSTSQCRVSMFHALVLRPL